MGGAKQKKNRARKWAYGGPDGAYGAYGGRAIINGANKKKHKWAYGSGAQWSAVQWSGVEWSAVEWILDFAHEICPAPHRPHRPHRAP